MASYELFCQFTSKDQDKGISGVYFSRPTIVGLVETDGNQIKRPERMQYFQLPKSDKYPLDLNQGYENYKQRPEDYYKDKLSKVAFVIMEKNLFGKSQDIVGDGAVEMKEHNCDVILHLGVLSELMQTPYQSGADNTFPVKWCILATRFKQKLFLTTKGDGDLTATLNSSHHFKFKQYCFSDDPLIEPDSSVPIDESKQLFSIFRSKLKNLNLIYSAEVCGIQSSRKLRDVKDEAEVGQCPFVHTKLMRESIRNWMKNYRMLRWWIKAYMMGTNDIFVGFKTNEGLVEKPVRHILAQEVPINQRWSPKVCNKFAYTFIAKVIEKMKGIDCPQTCFEFVLNPEKACIEFRVHPGASEYSFLSDSFVEYLRQIS